jgi:hypothetical protein
MINKKSQRLCLGAPIDANFIPRGGFASVVGMFIGALISFVVNCTLIEISLSPFFSFYFGLLFMAVGFLIFFRAGSINVDPMQPDEGAKARKQQIQGFSSLVITSGVLCFLLDKRWFVGVRPMLKIPLYAVLGTSVSFALTFAACDVANYILGFFQATVAKPLIDSTRQVTLVLVLSVCVGAVYGFIFGVLDVEDEVAYNLNLALKRDENICWPIGVVVGAAGGLGNELLRMRENYELTTDWDADI